MVDRADRPEAEEAKKPARERSANRVFPAGVLVRELERVADKVGRGGVRGEDLVIEEGGTNWGAGKRSGSCFHQQQKTATGRQDPHTTHPHTPLPFCPLGASLQVVRGVTQGAEGGEVVRTHSHARHREQRQQHKTTRHVGKDFSTACTIIFTAKHQNNYTIYYLLSIKTIFFLSPQYKCHSITKKTWQSMK